MRSKNIRSCLPFLCLLGFLLPTLQVPAEIEAPGSKPLQPVPVKIRVERGKSVEIPLRVYGGGHVSVKYLIRSRPEFGSLIDSRMIDANHGVVTYEHSGEFGHNGDVFHYAAKSIGGVSAQVSVEIQITDRPPRLVALMRSDFGEVLIGTGATALVSITNEGGGIDRGVITATTPWRVTGDPTYAVGPEENTVFVLLCNPVSEGMLHGTLHFSSSPASSIMLHATAVPPFRIDPPEINLSLDHDSGTRFGSLRIKNNADLDRSIGCNGGDSLNMPKKILLAAGEHAEIRLQTKPEDLSAIDTTVSLEVAGYRTQFRVTAPAVPAIVEVDKTVLNFGEVSLRQFAEASFLVSNRGGEMAFLLLTVPPPFSLPDDPFEISLEPGEARKIGVGIRPQAPGKASGELIATGFQTELAIRLVARIPRAERGAKQSPPHHSSKTAEWPVLNEKVPLLEEAQVEKVTNTSATISWPTGGGKADGDYRLEARILSLRKETKKADIQWIPFSNVSFDRSGGETRATAANLTPGGGYNVRVVEIDPQGRILRASRTLQVVPFPERRFAITPIRVLVAILIIVVALITRQRTRKHRMVAQLARAT